MENGNLKITSVCGGRCGGWGPGRICRCVDSVQLRSHRTQSRFAYKFVCKRFDVACQLCEHCHCLLYVPLFAHACCEVLHILCEWGLNDEYDYRVPNPLCNLSNLSTPR